MEELDEFGIPIKTPQKNSNVDEFGIPLKKKVGSNSTSPATVSESTSGGGSSASAAIGKTPEGTMAWNQQKLKQNVPGYTSKYDAFKQAEKVSDDKIAEIKKSVDDRASDIGWNYLKKLGKQAVNTVSNAVFKMTSEGSTPEDLKVEVDSLKKEKDEAKRQLLQESITAKQQKKQAPVITKESVLERAKQIAVEKGVASEKESLRRKFIRNLPEDEKNQLTLYHAAEASSFAEKDKTLMDTGTILKAEAEHSLNELNGLIAKVQTEGVTPELKTEITEKSAKHDAILSDLVKAHDEYTSNQKNLGEASENLDFFKRDYGSLANIYGNLDNSIGTALKGALGAIDYGLSLKSELLGKSKTDEIIKAELKIGENEIDKETKKTSDNIAKPLSVSEINGFSDFGHWMSETVLASQIPIYAMVATGAPGIAAIGATSLGQKYEEMQGEMASGEMDYSKLEQYGVPIGYGAAETVSAAVDAMVLKNAGRVIRSAGNGERALMADGFWKQLKTNAIKSGGSALKNAVYEAADETGTQIAENFLDIASGKQKNLLDGVTDAGAAGGAMALLMGIGAGGIKIVADGTKQFSTDTKLQKASDELNNLQLQLKNPTIADDSRAAIQGQVDKATRNVENLLKKRVAKVKNMPQEQFDEIMSLELKQAELRKNAKAIAIDENMSEEAKKIVLVGLENDFKSNDQRRIDLIDRGGNVALSKLDDEQLIVAKDKASRDLMKELNPDGTKNITLTDEQITKRAGENLIKKQQKELAKETVAVAEANKTLTPLPEAQETSISEVQEDISNTQEAVEPQQQVKATQEEFDNISLAPTNDGKFNVVKKGGNASFVLKQDLTIDEANAFLDEINPNKTKEITLNEQKSENKDNLVPETPLNEQTQVDFAKKQIDSGVLQWSGDMGSPRIDLGISWADIRKGESDIKRGKENSVPAKRLIEALNKGKEDGGFHYKYGTGGNNQRAREFVTFEEVQRSTNEFALTDAEIEEINNNEGQLYKEANDYFNTLDENSQIEILENYEGKIDNSAEVGQDTQSGEGKNDVSSKKTSSETNQEIVKKGAKKSDDKSKPSTFRVFNVKELKDNSKALKADPDYATSGYPYSFASMYTDLETLVASGYNNVKVGDVVTFNNKKYAIESLPFEDKVKMVRIDDDGNVLRKKDLSADEYVTDTESERPENVDEVKPTAVPKAPKTTKTKAEKIDASAVTIDDFFNHLKEILPKAAIDPSDYKAQGIGLSQDQIIDYVAAAAKKLAATGIEISEAIKQVVEGLKEKFNIDIDSDEIKSKIDINEIGLTKKDVKELREELGEEQFKYEVRTNAERIVEAKKMIANGYNIASLITKMSPENKHLPSGLEVEIIKQYYASLTEEINKNPTPELLKQRQELLNTIDVAKVEQGRSIQAWDGLTGGQDNLANFLSEESRYVDLNEEQIKELTEKYNKAQEALKQLQQKLKDQENTTRNKKAVSEIQKAKNEARRTGNNKLVHEAYEKQRKEALQAALKAWKNAGKTGMLSSDIPYRAQLFAIAPHVSTYMKSYVDEGIYDLDTIIKKIHKEFKEYFDELQETDVRDIIAGEYKEPSKTKNEITAQIRDLQTQARLEKQIEDLEKGIVKKKPERVKVINEKLDELRKQIKEIQKRNPELVFEEKLDAKKRWLRQNIERLKRDIEEGNFDEVEEPKQILLDDEALRFKDEYIKFKEEMRVRRQTQQHNSLSKLEKIGKKVRQTLATRRLVQTSIDLSIPFRQGTSVMLNPRTIALGAEAYWKMLKSVKSEMNYDRMMFDIEQDPMYLQSKEDGITFQEVGSLKDENRDEFHQDHYLYRVPILGKALMGSERAAAAWSNYARFELYKRGAKQLQAQGKTRENSKQAYEDMSARTMVNTGRGKIPLISDSKSSVTDSAIKQFLGHTLYGSRLVSATFRKLNPLYYLNPKVDRTVRVEALKDMIGYTTGLIITGGSAAAALGMTISFDPDDSDFMKLRKGDKVVDITGGQATYVRTFLRLVKAAYKQSDPNTSHKKAVKYSKFAMNSGSSFWRNKLAPNTSYAVNFLYGQNSLGEDFDPYEILRIYPMYGDDIKKAFDKSEYLDLMTILPISVLGLGYQNYPDRKK